MLASKRYQIDKLIYKTNNFHLFKGYDSQKGQPSFFKIVADGNYPEKRLKQEYEIAKSLQGLNGVANFYDRISYQDRVGLVFSYFVGKLLADIIKQQEFSLEYFLNLAIKLTELLGKIHENNIIHRNLKSTAILVNQTKNELKLFDLSSALPSKHLEENEVELNNRIIDLAYSAPEAVGRTEKSTDYRSDIYSLGVVFYELLTFRLPFTVKDKAKLLHFHLAKEVPSPVEINPQVPEVVAEITLKMLNKSPEARYQKLAGLKHDLLRCRKMFENEGKISSFALAQTDISDEFKVKDRLYGREEELNELHTIYNRVSQGEQELALVKGRAGLGKSALINKFRTQVNCTFITAKYEQFKKNAPYSGFIAAAKQLVEEILTKSKAAIEDWKERILSALGDKGGLLIEFIPELELIIGSQPSLSELPLENNKSVFNLVWYQFLALFADSEQPLVIFLDDLQWIDLSSLELLDMILREYKLKNLLIIGAYRDNEIKEGDLLFSRLNELKADALLVNTISLETLQLKDVKQLIADALNCSQETVHSLAKLSLNKTHGNPFFLETFLYSLVEEELIKYDYQEDNWQWQLDEIKRMYVTDNVVQLLIKKINNLSQAKQNILKLAACLGNKFNLNMLSIIAQRSEGDILIELEKLAKEKVIIAQKDIKSLTREKDKTFTFAHDKVQQAAYSLIKEETKAEIHLQIGELMLDNLSAKEQEDRLFALVDHLNQGRRLVTAIDKKRLIAEFNLRAGKKALTAVAYEKAIKYFKVGLDLLRSYCWEEDYDLMLNLYLKAAEASYLAGSFIESKELLEKVFANAASLIDKMKAYDIKIKLLEKEKKHRAAIETGIEALDLLGLDLSLEPEEDDFAEEIARVKEFVNDNSIEDIVKRPTATAATVKFKLKILQTISISAYLAAPRLFPVFIVKMVILTIDQGNSLFAPVAYSYLGVGASKRGEYDFANKLGKISLALLEELETAKIKAIEPRVLYVVYQFIFLWTKPIKEMIESLTEVYELSLEQGDFEAVGKAAYRVALRKFFVGESLSELEKELGEYREILVQIKEYVPLNFINILAQTVQNLRGENKEPVQFLGPAYDERTDLPANMEANDNYSVGSFYLYKLIISYLLERKAKAQENLAQALNYEGAMVGDPAGVLLTFYRCLVVLDVDDKIETAKKEEVLTKADELKDKFACWSEYCETNFLNKYYLLEAKYSEVVGNEMEAVKNYREAINLAREEGYVNDEAIANELAAKFWFSRNDDCAQLHLKKAYSYYQAWGLEVKVRKMEEEYPGILLMGEEQNKIGVSSNPVKDLDLEAVMKVNQAFTKEIVLDELIKKLIATVIETAGAQKIAFIMNEEELRIKGKKEVEQEEVTLVDESLKDNNYLPLSIINYVARTKENVVINDLNELEKFKSDKYIAENNSQSIVAIALVTRGEVEGIIYLENNFIAGVFPKERIKILEMISSQMAISIRNANLYQSLKESEEKLKKHKEELEMTVALRTKDLAEKNQKLKEANAKLKEMSFLDGLTQIPNRRRFNEVIQQEWKSSQQNNTVLSLIILDIDNFKSYNDTHGHLAGDECIKQVANVLEESVNLSQDFVARYGGEEFVVILPKTDVEEAKEMAESIRKRVKSLEVAHGTSRISDYVTVSLGVATNKPDKSHISIDKFIDVADKALYQAKNEGQNQVQTIVLPFRS
ncbi:MAG: diguanylate cyclase [Halanaerobacter sp.]